VTEIYHTKASPKAGFVIALKAVLCGFAAARSAKT
jgi:hypothetical protein